MTLDEERQSELNPWVRFALRTLPKGEPLADLASSIYQRRRSRARALLEETSAFAQTSLEELLIRLLENERRVDLLERALHSACTSTDPEKRRGLARALAGSVHDDTRVDESELLLGMLEKLEVVHIRVLHELARPHSGEGQLEGFETFGGVTSGFLAGQIPGLAPVADVLLTQLRAAGLIDNTIRQTYGGVGGKAMWGLTAAGERLLDLLMEEDR